MEIIKKTAIHDWHVASGANMAAFASYDMPLWYPSGAKNEHLAVISAAGLFDTSHMAVLTVGGASARKLLQRCFSKDLETCLGPQRLPLVEGRCVYGVFLDARGHLIDDSIVYHVGPDLYMVVVNAGMGAGVAAHLDENNENLDARIVDLTDRVGKIDIQGPASGKILKKVVRNPETVFGGMVYFSFKGGFGDSLPGASPVQLVDGTSALVSRTGYTGEFGFELYLDGPDTAKTWELLLAAGREHGMLPCGLAARDSLRTGAALPLSHQDIGDWPFANNPWLFALPWDSDGRGFSKDFIGAEALRNMAPQEHTLAFAGYDPRKINACDENFVTDADGVRIGRILTCTTDMSIGRIDGKIVGIAGAGKPADFAPRGLCCGFVKMKRPAAAGENIVLTDGKRSITVEIRDDIRPGRTARNRIESMLQ